MFCRLFTCSCSFSTSSFNSCQNTQDQHFIQFTYLIHQRQLPDLATYKNCSKQISSTSVLKCRFLSCVYNTWQSTIDNMRLSQILVENHDFCPPHLHSVSPLGAPHQNVAIWKKLEWCGYLTVKKSLMISLAILIEYQHVTDRQTNRQMDKHLATV